MCARAARARPLPPAPPLTLPSFTLSPSTPGIFLTLSITSASVSSSRLVTCMSTLQGPSANFMCGLAEAALERLTTPTLGPEKVKKIHLVRRKGAVPKPMRRMP